MKKRANTMDELRPEYDMATLLKGGIKGKQDNDLGNPLMSFYRLLQDILLWVSSFH